jgi:uncharacterized small protein (DUF1192 family)
MPTIEILSAEELEERRTALLAEVDMTEDELRNRGRTYSLSVHEAGILTEIDGLDFLLGE